MLKTAVFNTLDICAELMKYKIYGKFAFRLHM